MTDDFLCPTCDHPHTCWPNETVTCFRVTQHLNAIRSRKRCGDYEPTRTKQLEDALRNVCSAWTTWFNEQQAVSGDWIVVDRAVLDAEQLLGK